MSMVQLEGGTISQNVLVDKRFTAESDLERNISTASSEYVRYAPIGGVNQAQIEFQVEPSVGYVDLKNSYIQSQIRPRKAGGDLALGDLIQFKAFTSLLQWSDVKTYVNDVELSDENSGLYPYTAFAKVALSESNVKNSTLTIVPGTQSNPSGSVNVLSSNDPRSVEGVLCPDGSPLCGGLISMTSTYQNYRNAGNLGGRNDYIDTMTKIRDGIWQQSEYLPPSVRIRCVLTKNSDSQLIEDANDVTSVNTVDYNSCFLYLKRVYPTPSMQTVAKQLMLERGMLYTLLRARTAQVTYNQTQTSLSVSGLLASQNPSYVLVGFYSALTDTQIKQNHAFNSDIKISSLYIRVGGMRIPENYDYERLTATTQAGSLVDYNEYVLACKASSQNTTISDNEIPLLSFEAYKNFSFFVFNCKSNKETMWGRDDSSNSKGAVDVYARFNSGGPNTNANMIVIGLGHDKVHISADGKVQRLGW
jgi:hypothetical protein